MAVQEAVMSEPGTSTPRRGTSRRIGYAIAVAINLVLLYLVLVEPGWQALVVLTEDFADVLGVLTLSLVVGAVVNLVWIVADPPWLRSLGQLTTTGISLVVVVELLTTYPFDFSPWGFDPQGLGRLVLGALALALGIAWVVEVVRFVRLVLRWTTQA